MAFRGQRFDIDLSSDDEHDVPGARLPSQRRNPAAPALPGFVKDVTERPTASAKPPVAPTPKITANGFPVHRKRTPTPRFKQDRPAHSTAADQTQPTGQVASRVGLSQDGAPLLSAAEREQIDKENRERLANMSDESIAKERQELMDGLSPSLIQRLLRRANIDDPQDVSFPETDTQQPPRSSAPTKTVTFNIDDTLISPNPGSATNDTELEQDDARQKPDPLSTILEIPPPPSSTHFPRIPQLPALDPSSPNFLTDLHEKYFPNLAHDPSKLAWMSPDASASSGADETSAGTSYDPQAQDLPIAALRFSFTGALLAPSTAQSIPVSKGLHHHGDAPDAAGYTIGELARLARSQFPSQRCFAFQTLGRILYRLGIGEFGRLERGFRGARVAGGDADADDNNDDEGEGLAKGLWDCVRDGRVLETLEEEARKEGGHVSAKAYAVEALWLWRKGGGTEVRAT